MVEGKKKKSDLDERKVPWRLNAQRAALLVIDMQNDFLEKGAVLEVPMARKILPNLKKLLSACRKSGIPVVYTAHEHLPDGQDSPLELAYFPQLKKRGLRRGTRGVEIYDEIAPTPGDLVIKKHRYDAFYNTDLDTLLRNIRGPGTVDTLIITGTVTNICCESTARSAFMRDYKVVFVSDATGGIDKASHDATLKIIGLAFGRISSTAEVIAELKYYR